MSQLFFGDNLHVLRDHLATESVDLVFLDLPFNSKRDYNLQFKSPVGSARRAGCGHLGKVSLPSQPRITAFGRLKTCLPARNAPGMPTASRT